MMPICNSYVQPFCLQRAILKALGAQSGTCRFAVSLLPYLCDPCLPAGVLVLITSHLDFLLSDGPAQMLPLLHFSSLLNFCL